MWLYRLGRRNNRRRHGLVRWLVSGIYGFLYRPIELLTGVTLPKSARIGPGLLIWHFGNVLVHEDAVIGANCTMRHGVTIGIRHEGGPVPTLGDDVELGAYAVVLGGVRIGHGAKIGAMTLVLQDVPPGATAVGVPARIIEKGAGQAGYVKDVAYAPDAIEAAPAEDG